MVDNTAGAPAVAKDEAGLWTRNFILVCFSNLAVFMGFQLLLPAMPVYVKKLGAQESMVGLVMGIFTLSSVLVRPWAGLQLDRKGRKGIFLSGVSFSILSVFLYNWAATIPLLLLLRLLHGFGWGQSTTAAGTIATDLIPPYRRGEGMGYYGLSGNLAMAVAPALGLLIMQRVGFTPLFFTSVLLALVGLLLASFLHLQPVVKQGTLHPALFEVTAFRASLLVFLLAITYGGLVTFIALHALQRGISNIGYFFTVYAAVLMLSRPLAGRVFDRRGALPVILPGLLLVAASMQILAGAVTLGSFLWAGAFFGLGFGFVQPTLQALAVAKAPPNRRGAANGTYLSAFDLGIGVGSVLLGIISQKIGYSGMYQVASGLALLCLLVFLAWRPSRA